MAEDKPPARPPKRLVTLEDHERAIAAAREQQKRQAWVCVNGIPYCRHCDVCGYPAPCGRDHGEDERGEG